MAFRSYFLYIFFLVIFTSSKPGQSFPLARQPHLKIIGADTGLSYPEPTVAHWVNEGFQIHTPYSPSQFYSPTSGLIPANAPVMCDKGTIVRWEPHFFPINWYIPQGKEVWYGNSFIKIGSHKLFLLTQKRYPNSLSKKLLHAQHPLLMYMAQNCDQNIQCELIDNLNPDVLSSLSQLGFFRLHLYNNKIFTTSCPLAENLQIYWHLLNKQVIQPIITPSKRSLPLNISSPSTPLTSELATTCNTPPSSPRELSQSPITIVSEKSTSPDVVHANPTPSLEQPGPLSPTIQPNPLAIDTHLEPTSPALCNTPLLPSHEQRPFSPVLQEATPSFPLARALSTPSCVEKETTQKEDLIPSDAQTLVSLENVTPESEKKEDPAPTSTKKKKKKTKSQSFAAAQASVSLPEDSNSKIKRLNFMRASVAVYRIFIQLQGEEARTPLTADLVSLYTIIKKEPTSLFMGSTDYNSSITEEYKEMLLKVFQHVRTYKNFLVPSTLKIIKSHFPLFSTPSSFSPSTLEHLLQHPHSSFRERLEKFKNKFFSNLNSITSIEESLDILANTTLTLEELEHLHTKFSGCPLTETAKIFFSKIEQETYIVAYAKNPTPELFQKLYSTYQTLKGRDSASYLLGFLGDILRNSKSSTSSYNPQLISSTLEYLQPSLKEDNSQSLESAFIQVFASTFASQPFDKKSVKEVLKKSSSQEIKEGWNNLCIIAAENLPADKAHTLLSEVAQILLNNTGDYSDLENLKELWKLSTANKKNKNKILQKIKEEFSSGFENNTNTSCAEKNDYLVNAFFQAVLLGQFLPEDLQEYFSDLKKHIIALETNRLNASSSTEEDSTTMWAFERYSLFLIEGLEIQKKNPPWLIGYSPIFEFSYEDFIIDPEVRSDMVSHLKKRLRENNGNLAESYAVAQALRITLHYMKQYESVLELPKNSVYSTTEEAIKDAHRALQEVFSSLPYNLQTFLWSSDLLWNKYTITPVRVG